MNIESMSERNLATTYACTFESVRPVTDLSGVQKIRKKAATLLVKHRSLSSLLCHLPGRIVEQALETLALSLARLGIHLTAHQLFSGAGQLRLQVGLQFKIAVVAFPLSEETDGHIIGSISKVCKVCELGLWCLQPRAGSSGGLLQESKKTAAMVPRWCGEAMVRGT